MDTSSYLARHKQEDNATVPRRKSRDFPQLLIITRGWLIIGLSHETGSPKTSKITAYRLEDCKTPDTQFPPSWPSITICWPGNLKLPPAAASRVFCHLAHSVSSQRVPRNPWPLIGCWLVTLVCDWTSLVSAQARGQ